MKLDYIHIKNAVVPNWQMLLLTIKEVIGGHLLNHGSLFWIILTDVIIMVSTVAYKLKEIPAWQSILAEKPAVFSNHLLRSMLQNVLLFLGQLSLVKEDKKFSLSVYHLKAILCNFFGYLRVLYYLSGITIWVCKLRVRKICNCWWSLAVGNGTFTEAFSCKI